MLTEQRYELILELLKQKKVLLYLRQRNCFTLPNLLCAEILQPLIMRESW